MRSKREDATPRAGWKGAEGVRMRGREGCTYRSEGGVGAEWTWITTAFLYTFFLSGVLSMEFTMSSCFSSVLLFSLIVSSVDYRVPSVL